MNINYSSLLCNGYNSKLVFNWQLPSDTNFKISKNNLNKPNNLHTILYFWLFVIGLSLLYSFLFGAESLSWLLCKKISFVELSGLLAYPLCSVDFSEIWSEHFIQTTEVAIQFSIHRGYLVTVMAVMSLRLCVLIWWNLNGLSFIIKGFQMVFIIMPVILRRFLRLTWELIFYFSIISSSFHGEWLSNLPLHTWSLV